MGQHWQQPGPPSRGIRLLVFAALVVASLVIAIAVISFFFTLSVAPVAS